MRMSILGSLLVGAIVVVGISPRLQAQENQSQAVQQAIQAARGAAGAPQAVGQVEGVAAQIQAVEELGEHYAAMGADKLIQELERLAIEAEDTSVRREALRSLRAADAARLAPAPATGAAVAAPSFSDMRVISVECNGECGDSRLSTLCRLAGTGFTPYAVDCRDVDDDNPGVQCGGGGDNRCLQRRVLSSDRLDWYCDDTSGWDAQVYCAR